MMALPVSGYDTPASSSSASSSQQYASSSLRDLLDESTAPLVRRERSNSREPRRRIDLPRLDTLNINAAKGGRPLPLPLEADNLSYAPGSQGRKRASTVDTLPSATEPSPGSSPPPKIQVTYARPLPPVPPGLRDALSLSPTSSSRRNMSSPPRMHRKRLAGPRPVLEPGHGRRTPQLVFDATSGTWVVQPGTSVPASRGKTPVGHRRGHSRSHSEQSVRLTAASKGKGKAKAVDPEDHDDGSPPNMLTLVTGSARTTPNSPVISSVSPLGASSSYPFIPSKGKGKEVYASDSPSVSAGSSSANYSSPERNRWDRSPSPTRTTRFRSASTDTSLTTPTDRTGSREIKHWMLDSRPSASASSLINSLPSGHKLPPPPPLPLDITNLSPLTIASPPSIPLKSNPTLARTPSVPDIPEPEEEEEAPLEVFMDDGYDPTSSHSNSTRSSLHSNNVKSYHRKSVSIDEPDRSPSPMRYARRSSEEYLYVGANADLFVNSLDDLLCDDDEEEGMTFANNNDSSSDDDYDDEDDEQHDGDWEEMEFSKNPSPIDGEPTWDSDEDDDLLWDARSVHARRKRMPARRARSVSSLGTGSSSNVHFNVAWARHAHTVSNNHTVVAGPQLPALQPNRYIEPASPPKAPPKETIKRSGSRFRNPAPWGKITVDHRAKPERFVIDAPKTNESESTGSPSMSFYQPQFVAVAGQFQRQQQQQPPVQRVGSPALFQQGQRTASPATYQQQQGKRKTSPPSTFQQQAQRTASPAPAVPGNSSTHQGQRTASPASFQQPHTKGQRTASPAAFNNANNSSPVIPQPQKRKQSPAGFVVHNPDEDADVPISATHHRKKSPNPNARISSISTKSTASAISTRSAPVSGSPPVPPLPAKPVMRTSLPSPPAPSPPPVPKLPSKPIVDPAMLAVHRQQPASQISYDVWIEGQGKKPAAAAVGVGGESRGRRR